MSESFDKYDFILEISSKLNKTEKTKLLKLISQSSESSYRRGVQQTLCAVKKGWIDDWIVKDDATSYRFDRSLKTSIGLDGFQTSSKERLLSESHEFRWLDNK